MSFGKVNSRNEAVGLFRHLDTLKIQIRVSSMINSLLVVSLGLFVQSGLAAPISQLAEKVFELRSQIEKLGQDIEFNRKSNEAVIEPLLAKKAELIAQIEKENLRKIQIDEKIKSVAVRKSYQNSESYKSEMLFLLSWVTGLIDYTQSQIPYRSAQRLEVLEDLQKKLQSHYYSNLQALDELVKISESELKLIQSKEFRVMPIMLGEKQVTAETVRLGLMQMAFGLPKNEYGYYEFTENNNWKPVLVKSSEEKEQIQRLIAHFKDKNTKGWFMVPVSKSEITEVVK
jgi:hypothetical protein